MLKSIESPFKPGGFRGRGILISILSALILSIDIPAQDQDYWADAPLGTTKIFSVSFIDKTNGLAKSAELDVLYTSDSGKTWEVKENIRFINHKTTPEILWTADIFCSIMKTTDGGNTWLPYEEEKQEHFCGVYLRDPNTGYKVASEFLNKVTSEINNHYENGNLDSLLDHPQKCSEYYSSAEEGWSLEWCVRNFN
jgi:hypothetical protein